MLEQSVPGEGERKSEEGRRKQPQLHLEQGLRLPRRRDRAVRYVGCGASSSSSRPLAHKPSLVCFTQASVKRRLSRRDPTRSSTTPTSPRSGQSYTPPSCDASTYRAIERHIATDALTGCQKTQRGAQEVPRPSVRQLAEAAERRRDPQLPQRRTSTDLSHLWFEAFSFVCVAHHAPSARTREEMRRKEVHGAQGTAAAAARVCRRSGVAHAQSHGL